VTRVQGLIKDVLATTPDEIDQDVFEPGMLTSMPLIELRDRAEFTVDYRYVSRAQLAADSAGSRSDSTNVTSVR
jgi:hypothetical protein